MKKLPHNTPSQVRRALRDIKDYSLFKHELHGEIRYLEDYGGMPAAAHVVNQEQPSGRDDRDHDEPDHLHRVSGPSREQGVFTVYDIPAVMRTV